MNLPMDEATIFAPATATGRGGIAVFRVSGSSARQALIHLCPPNAQFQPRQAVLTTIHHPESGLLIDQAVVLFFPGPHSFTGEDVVEFHTHGGRAVAAAMSSALSSLDGFRLAEAGEFTRRAFQNGKLDLTEAEAIADLVNAETEAQRKQALRQLQGELGDFYRGLAERLTKYLAYLEATIDFSEEDLPEALIGQSRSAVHGLLKDIDRHLADGHRGERLREGFQIAILGAPNAGKSSLLNALARRDVAIVSAEAGTTRDVIEVHLDLGGYPVTLADTAGLRETDNIIEREGIRRAKNQAHAADLKLLVFDGERWPERDPETEALIDDHAIIVVSKSDLIRNIKENELTSYAISSRNGDGIPKLLKAIQTIISATMETAGPPPLTQARHRTALEECRTALTRAYQAQLPELCAEDMRLALRSLGRITGAVDVEDMLDIIFRDFCIGK